MKKLRLSLLISAAVLVGACSSPEERAQEYYENGQELLDAGETVRAKLDFQNALQLNQNMPEVWFGLAKIAERENEWEDMFNILRRVVDMDPEHLEAQLDLAKLLLGAGQLDQALEISNTTMELGPENADVLAVRAAIFLRLEDSATAIELARQALELHPEHIDALTVLATQSLSNSDPFTAITYLDRAISGDPDNVALYLIKAQALHTLEEFGQEEELYKLLIEKNPGNPAFRQQLAAFYLDQERNAEAEQIFRDMVANDPGNYDYKLNLVRFVNSTKGMDAAQAEVNALIETYPDETNLGILLSQMYELNGQQELSISTLEDLAEKTTRPRRKREVQAMLARQYLRHGQKERAMSLVEEILAADPRSQDALLLKATEQLDTRQLDQAIGDLRLILRDTPNSPEALLLLAKAHELDGAVELADDVYGRAFLASGRNPDYAVPYATFLLKKVDSLDDLSRESQDRDTLRAAEVLEESLRTRGDNIDALTILAQIRLNQGDLLATQQIADHLKRLEGTDALSNEIMGAIYAQQEDIDQSLEAFEKAYESSPDATRPMVAMVSAYLAKGEVGRAMEFLRSVSEVSSNGNADVLLARLHIAQGERETGVELLHNVMEKDPTNIAAYTNMATLYLVEDKDADAALEMLEKGLSVVPNDFTLNLMKAGIFESREDFDSAIAVYEHMLTVQPNADVIANNLASLLSDHRSDEASLRRANNLAQRFRSSNIPHFLDTLGWSYYRLGNFDEAVDLVEEAVEREPSVAIFRYHLGKVYQASQNTDDARSEYEAVIEMAGADPDEYPFLNDVRESIAEL